jgi:Ca2+-binding EF-hand superfamily protein
MFLRLMRQHFTIEESSELLRKRLSRRPNFNVHSAFSHIDRDNNGYLTSEDFRRLLADN